MLNKKNNCWLVCILALLVNNPAWSDHASVALGVGTAAPISTESAVTLPEGNWAVGIRSEYQELDSFSDKRLRELREQDEEGDFHSVDSLWNNSIAVSYGVTDDFTVGIRLPFIHRNDIKEPEHGHGGEVEHEEEEEEHEEESEHEEENEHDEAELAEIVQLGDVEGIGDLSVFGEYRFYKNEGTHIAAIFGFKAPTGKTNRNSDQGERLDLELQPGSGSWDGMVGAAFTQEMGAFSFYSSVLYTFVTEGHQHTDLGDIFTYNGALAYRVLGQQGQSYLPPKFALDLIAEVNGEWRDKEKTRGHHDDNSGGNLVYISPGVRVSMPYNASLGFSFGIPVVKDTNGDQVEPDYRMVTSASISW